MSGYESFSSLERPRTGGLEHPVFDGSGGGTPGLNVGHGLGLSSGRKGSSTMSGGGSQREPPGDGRQRTPGERRVAFEEEPGDKPRARQRKRRDSKQFWMEDGACKACFNCEAPFTLFRRKHHCRSCGAIYCDKCSSKTADGTLYGYEGQVRVCDACFESATQVKHGMDRLRNLSRIKSHASGHVESTSSSSGGRDTAAEAASPKSAGVNDKAVPEESQVPEPTTGKLVRSGGTRRVRWIEGDEESRRRRQSAASGQPSDLVEAFELTRNRRSSVEDRLGTPGAALRRTRSNSAEMNKAFLLASAQGRSKSFKRSLPFRVREGSNESDEEDAAAARTANELREGIGFEPGNIEAAQRMQHRVFSKRVEGAVERLVLRELTALRHKRPSIILSDETREAWRKELRAITERFCSSVRPFNMDFDTYCKVVCIPGGTISECNVLNGVICEMNVVHRDMRRHIEHPRILLISGPIEFLRDKSRISSFDTLREQEQQYMELVVRKITSLGVDVLLVGSSMSRIAQRLLRQAGVSVVINVPTRLMQRVSWLTGAFLLPATGNITQQSDPRGTCELWTLRTINTQLSDAQQSELLKAPAASGKDSARSFMFFEGCPPRLGASICLRGGSPQALEHMERILTTMITATYTLKQETALFADIGVIFGEDRLANARALAEEDKLLSSDSLNICKVLRQAKEDMSPSELRRLSFGNTGSDLTLGDFLRKRCFSSLHAQGKAGGNTGLNRRGANTARGANGGAGSGASSGATGGAGGAGAGSGGASSAAPGGAAQRDGGESRSQEPGGSNGKDNAQGSKTASPTGIGPMGATSSAMLQSSKARQEEESSRTQQQSFTVYQINSSRLVVFNAQLSKTDATQGELYERLMSARREYVAENIRRLSNLSNDMDRPPSSWALPIRTHSILTWSECKLCPATTSYQVLSKDAESLSFGRWLQLKFFFRAKNLAAQVLATSEQAMCKHSVFQDYITYFECMGQVAGFELERCPRFAVSIPPGDYQTPIKMPGFAEKWRMDQLRRKKETLDRLLNKLKTEFLDARLLEYKERFGTGPESKVDGLVQTIQDQLAFHRDIVDHQEGLLQLNRVRRELVHLTREWNDQLEDIVATISTRLMHSSERSNQKPGALQGLFRRIGSADSSTASEPSAASSRSQSGPSPTSLAETETETETETEEMREPVSAPDSSFAAPLPAPPAPAPPTQTPSIVTPGSRSVTLMNVLQSATQPFRAERKHRLPRLRSGSEDVVASIPPPRVDLVRSASSDPRGAMGADATDTEPATFLAAGALEDIESRAELLQPVELPDAILTGRPDLPAGFGNSVVFVHEDEPTSWVAHALNSKEHRQRLFKFAEECDMLEEFQNGEWHKILSGGTPGQKANSMELHFADGPSARASEFRFSVKVYCPLRFHALRQGFFNWCTSTGDRVDPENSFLESLSRCNSWQATGGKSKSQFFKCRDGRFIVKSISTEELEMFLSISPGYFEHLGETLEKSKPSALLRIVGVFTIVSSAAPTPPLVHQDSDLGTEGASEPDTPPELDAADSEAGPGPGRPSSSPTASLGSTGRSASERDDRSLKRPGTAAAGPSSREGKGHEVASSAAQSGPAALPRKSSLPPRLGALLLDDESAEDSDAVASPRTLELYRETTVSSTRSAQLSGRLKTHVIVLEQLFPGDEEFKVKFDLKGNFRNRLVANPREDEVLMDRNFQQYQSGLPLALEPRAMEILRQAVERDTAFLEREGVVDYSLLLGIPAGPKADTGKASPLLRLGLIDFLQLYNVKKMIESNVKRAGMIAGQLEPTVIDPNGYRARLRRALRRYFAAVPDSPLAELDDDEGDSPQAPTTASSRNRHSAADAIQI